MMGKKHITVTAYITIFALIFLSGFSITEAKPKNNKPAQQEKPSIIEIIKEAIVEPAPRAEPTPTPSAAPEVDEEDDDDEKDETPKVVPQVIAPPIDEDIEEEEEVKEEVKEQDEIKLVEPSKEASLTTIIEKLIGKKKAQKKIKEEIKVIAKPLVSTSTQSTSTPATTTPVVAGTKPEPPKTLAKTASAINEQVKSWSAEYRLDPLAWAINYSIPKNYYAVTDNLSTPLSLGLLALSTTLGISGFVLLQRPKQYRAAVPSNTLSV